MTLLAALTRLRTNNLKGLSTTLTIEEHGQQVRPRPSSRDHMEWRRCLADFLAVPAGELFPYRLDHFPLPRDHFQGPRPKHCLEHASSSAQACKSYRL